MEIDSCGERAADDFELLTGPKLVWRGDSVDLGEQLPRHVVLFGDGFERFARLHDAGGLETMVGRIDHSSRELVE